MNFEVTEICCQKVFRDFGELIELIYVQMYCQVVLQTINLNENIRNQTFDQKIDIRLTMIATYDENK